jgi:PAS domain-containing protein
LQRDERQQPRAILKTNNDITERKRAQADLRQSEEQWRDVFEKNPTMYFIADAPGEVKEVNPFGAEQLGYTVDELVGHWTDRREGERTVGRRDVGPPF